MKDVWVDRLHFAMSLENQHLDLAVTTHVDFLLDLSLPQGLVARAAHCRGAAAAYDRSGCTGHTRGSPPCTACEKPLGREERHHGDKRTPRWAWRSFLVGWACGSYGWAGPSVVLGELLLYLPPLTLLRESRHLSRLV